MKRSTFIVYVLVIVLLMAVTLAIIIFFPEVVGLAVITEFVAVILAIILMSKLYKVT